MSCAEVPQKVPETHYSALLSDSVQGSYPGLGFGFGCTRRQLLLLFIELSILLGPGPGLFRHGRDPASTAASTGWCLSSLQGSRITK